MIQNQFHSFAATSGSFGTSAHETGTVTNTNLLRVWNPYNQTRRRHPSDTSALRAALCDKLMRAFPKIRRIRLRDTGILFIARIRMKSGRILCQKAYNLRNLEGLLKERIETSA